VLIVKAGREKRKCKIDGLVKSQKESFYEAIKIKLVQMGPKKDDERYNKTEK